MLAHVGPIAVQIKIDVVGQIHRTGFIDRRPVGDGDSIVIGQTILRRGAQMAVKAPSPSSEVSANNAAIVLVHNLPAALVKAFRSAV